MPHDYLLQHIAWRNILETQARIIRLHDEALAKAGLIPVEQYDVLLPLAEAPGHRLRLSELAERVILSRSGITRLVDRLEAKGLLKRESCPEDRRGSYAVITKAGLAAMKQAWGVMGKILDEQFAAHVRDEEAAAIHSALVRVLKANGSEVGEVSAPVQIGIRRK